jgi:peptide/nickel transport system substrate-binding protein
MHVGVTHRKRWTAITLASLMVMAVATVARAGSGGAAQVDEIVWGLQAPTLSMDVAKASDINSVRVSGAAFDRVLMIDSKGKMRPWIASSWTNPDARTYIFKIRQGVRFWDGKPLTTADVAFSLRRHLDPKLASTVAGNLASVKSVKVTAANTVTVRLKTPDASFIYRAALDWHVVQEAYTKAAGADIGTPKKPGMGTGPYTVTKYSASEGATLERFDGYWGKKPQIAKIEFKVISDPEAARLAFLAGDIQGYFDVPLLASRRFDKLQKVKMTYVIGSYNDMLTLNVTKAPFDDPLVRRAIAQLTDRKGLAGPLFNGRAKVASTIVPDTQIVSSYGAKGAAALYARLPKIPAFNIEAAKATLAKSQYPNGFKVDLKVDTTQPWMLPLAQNLAANAKKVGITITPKPVSAADWVAEVSDSSKAGPLQLLALGAGTPNPAQLPPIILGKGPFNVPQYTSPTLEKQIAALVAAPTPRAGLPLLRKILTAVNRDLPYIPLYDEQTALALATGLTWQGGYSYWALGQVWPLSLRSTS